MEGAEERAVNRTPLVGVVKRRKLGMSDGDVIALGEIIDHDLPVGRDVVMKTRNTRVVGHVFQVPEDGLVKATVTDVEGCGTAVEVDKNKTGRDHQLQRLKRKVMFVETGHVVRQPR